MEPINPLVEAGVVPSITPLLIKILHLIVLYFFLIEWVELVQKDRVSVCGGFGKMKKNKREKMIWQWVQWVGRE